MPLTVGTVGMVRGRQASLPHLLQGHRHLLSEERETKQREKREREELGFRHYLSPEGEVCLEEGVRQHKDKR